MSKFIYLVSLKRENIEYKNIKSLEISSFINQYIKYLEYDERTKKETKFNIIKYFKNIYIVNKNIKNVKRILNIIKKKVKRKDRIILSKEIQNHKYNKKIENLIGKRYISKKSFSIIQHSTNFAENMLYNSACIISKKEIDYNLLSKLCDNFKNVDIHSNNKRNQKILDYTNKKLGTSCRIIKDNNLTKYDVIYNLDVDIEYLNLYKFKCTVTLFDDFNYLDENKIEDFLNKKYILNYYNRNSKRYLFNIENIECFRDYNISYIVYELNT